MDLQLQKKVILVNSNEVSGYGSFTSVLTIEGAVPVLIAERDLQNAEACRRVVAGILDRYGAIHGLINISDPAGFIGPESGSYELFMQGLEHELIPCFNLTQAVIPALKRCSGAILNIYKDINAGAWNALTRDWAVELLPYAIRVNGLIITDRIYPEQDDLARSAAFLLSACSSHTTGQLIEAAAK